MKTAMKIIAFMAVGYILAEVWYAGYSEGWRQHEVLNRPIPARCII